MDTLADTLEYYTDVLAAAAEMPPHLADILGVDRAACLVLADAAFDAWQALQQLNESITEALQ